MKIAILADAHGNYQALNAVLDDAMKHEVNEIWFLGDFIGFGPEPEKVVDLLKDERAKCVVGDYDLKVLDFPKNKTKWKKRKNPSKYFSIKWTHENISKPTKKYLKNLPKTLTLKREDLKFALVHDIASAFKHSDADIIVCGHSHKYFTKKANGIHFINPGSVGRSFDADPRASYVILEKSNGQLDVHHRRIKYPVKKILKKMKKEKFPRDIINSMEIGCSVDDIQLIEKNHK